MQNVAKKSPDPEPDKLVVYSFAGSIMLPTEQGAFWANAIGGVIASRPVGNPFILFDFKYLWDVAGQVSEFPEPIRIRLNTAMAVTETFDFKFQPPEAPAEVSEIENTPALMAGPDDEDDIEEDEGEDIDEDEGEDIDEDDDFEEGDDEHDATDDVEDELSQALHSPNEHEISW